MWTYKSECPYPEQINGGNMFTFRDVVIADTFNILVHNLIYVKTRMEE